MSIKSKIITCFDKRGLRWAISIIFNIVSLLKSKTLNWFFYDKKNNKWLQYHKGIFYFIDSKPNWNISIPYLENYVIKRNFIQYYPKNNDIIIDIGAGVGTETIIYCLKADKGKVYAIEAHPETCKSLFLLKNYNKFDNLFVSNIALSESNGIVKIESRDNHAENSIWRNNNGIPTEAFTLDEYVKNNNILRINFLKMNIEGAEIDVIKGMEESVKIIDYVAISCHDFLFPTNTNEIKDLVTEFLTINHFEVIFQNTCNKVKDSWVYAKKIHSN